MAALNLSLTVLDWAAKEAGRDRQSLAEEIAKRDDDRRRILQGELTIRQAEKVAKLARIPFGFLFLQVPPEPSRPSIPDLRRVTDAAPLSDDFFEVLADATSKQEWFIDHLREGGADSLPFVGRFRFASRPKVAVVAEDIRRTLGVTVADRTSSQDADAYFRKLSDRAEDQGILVMKSGIVRAFTRRRLSEGEFRGFAVAHPMAPIVFINGQDAVVASVFTLMHEIAHIWLGESGVSDLSPTTDRGIEIFCNAVSAEVLVPNHEFLAQWTNTPNVEALARLFRVSRAVIARRAFDNGLISWPEFELYLRPLPRKPREPGGDPFRTIPVRNSKRLTRAVVGSALSGETLLREAASLLNSKPDTVIKLGNRVFGREA
ncbi:MULTISPECIES: ImmA/IrrE family metallo-endopeptidase [unclassified Stenotrophomonas]|uniref:ImmA/IrrE family metallo-endopeptidase n=1 Tax=unclassified Stenotrophomonas TaxID=196198 RepID=UPI0018D7B598|nr:MULTISPECIES: ImmA/IrrE family metallo-endopeptidase [unclassified Stenotrophomonas]